uniref:Retrotransposon protein, putative, Ty1-copia subclass n=1 Tax=Tanacetum cinerariifolium TaxID=118510 RepID=A0A6L2MM48_TANCI|nr:hypothetical protein [Tanacetum cinerariifolium]
MSLKLNFRRYEKKIKLVEQHAGPSNPKTTDHDTIGKYYKTVNIEQEVACLMLSKKAKQELFETVQAFHAYKQEEGKSVSSYLLKMKSYLNTLERLGYAVPNELGKTIAKLHAMLKLYEKGISKKDETPTVLAIREGKIHKDKKKPQGAKGKDKRKNKLAYDSKPRIPPPPKRDNMAKDFVCYHCKEVGSLRKPKVKTWSFESVSGQWNANKRAKHALDSSYQWHCHLGHINKKRMDKLQRDGILQLTHNESLKKRYLKEMIGYYFYYPLKNKIFVARNVEFFENSLMVQEASGSHGFLELSVSDKGLELIQEDDTQPYENTSEVHNEEYELGDLNGPLDYKAALLDPESDKWLEAMNTKIQSMKDNQVWVLVERPPNGRTIRSKWIFKKKTEMDDKRLIALSQSAYLEKTLKKFRMENSKKGYTPMIENPDYKKSQGAQTPSELQHIRRVPYASAIEVEYIAVVEASIEALWMRKFIDGLGDVMPSNKRPMEMLCDNEHAIAIANVPKIMKGARHFQRKYHYIREVIQARENVLKKVYTNDNVADPFTKPMPFNKHHEHAMVIKIVPTSSLM